MADDKSTQEQAADLKAQNLAAQQEAIKQSKNVSNANEDSLHSALVQPPYPAPAPRVPDSDILNDPSSDQRDKFLHDGLLQNDYIPPDEQYLGEKGNR